MDKENKKEPRAKPKYRSINKWTRDAITKRVAELRLLDNLKWQEIGDIINDEFHDSLNGIPVSWHTLYGRLNTSLKKRKIVNPKETEKLIRKIKLMNERLQLTHFQKAIEGNVKSGKLVLELNEQLVKMFGCNAPEKHQVEQNLKLTMNTTDEEESALANIRKRFNNSSKEIDLITDVEVKNATTDDTE